MPALPPGMEITPAEAIKAFMPTARHEHGKREKIREGLNARRQTDRLRGSTPERLRAQAGRAKDALDPETQARQAASSGRTLTGDERANAPQEVKERLDRQDRKSAERGMFQSSTGKDQQSGKGRNGGGRGR